MSDVAKVVSTVSGGLVSYMATRRAVDQYGPGRVVGLFADTCMEDADLYRFVEETVASLGIELVTVKDGRNPWEVFVDEKFIGNSRADPCSKILKRQLMDRWRDEHCDPATTLLIFGLDWSERGRIEGSEKKKGHRRRMVEAGWDASYPMNEPPYMTKADIIDHLKTIGIRHPRLYDLGFPHNNCGGFCCKMGLAQARHLLVTLPDNYRWHEEQERLAIEKVGGTAQPCLRYRSGGKTRPVTLTAFREAFEQQMTFATDLDDHGWGCGGGCAIDD